MHASSTGLHAAPSSHDELWSRITASPRRLLILDYDGTLARFHADPACALPSRRVRDALRILAARHDPLVIISGRPVAELLELLHDLPLGLIGEHGWETFSRDGTHLAHELPHSTDLRLGLAQRAAIGCGWRMQLETKRTALVLHTRGLASADAESVAHYGRELWGRFFARDGLKLDAIDGGLELRAAQRDKGLASRELLQREPDGTLPVYIGDDITDEDAFRELRSAGVTIRVGPPEAPTAAEWRLASVDDVEEFLDRWRALVPETIQ